MYTIRVTQQFKKGQQAPYGIGEKIEQLELPLDVDALAPLGKAQRDLIIKPTRLYDEKVCPIV